MKLIAYRLRATCFPLRVSPVQKPWLQDLRPNRNFSHCLPLMMANQVGWEVLCPTDFSVTWNGNSDRGALRIDFPGDKTQWIASHFGEGILTFLPGYIYRTPPGHNLLVCGPANDPKDGIAPLEGLVETDWLPFNSTMSWVLTRPNATVKFYEGDPICRLIPVPRNYLEGFQAEVLDLSSNPELEAQNQQWEKTRADYLKRQATESGLRDWQSDYQRGRLVDGTKIEDHQTRMRLCPFEEK